MPADVATGLPELDLLPYAIVTVTLDDPAAVINSLTVHGFQVVPPAPPAPGPPAPLPLFVPIPADEPAVAGA